MNWPERLAKDVSNEMGLSEEGVLEEIRKMRSRAGDLFPFKENGNPSYRKHQERLIVESAIALWIQGYDNVVIDGPTGIGKSAVNYTLGRMANDSFYTTPQKSLRNQLQDDDALSLGMKTLRARQDYICGATNKDCSSCPINQSDDKSCKDQPDCTYWNNKVNTMDEQIAAITFAYLIVDDYIPTTSGDEQVSFGDRELLIVDECHTLESQVASLFAGFTLSPWSVPVDVYGNSHKKIKRIENNIDDHNDFRGILSEVAERAERFVQVHEGEEEKSNELDQCESFLRKYNYFKEEIDEGRSWVADVGEVGHPEHSGDVKSLEAKPVRVDRFLDRFVWSRGDKRILSTATMPYRENPEEWFRRLGLPGKTKVIKAPMPFPRENRPVMTDTEIASFSSGGDDENWHYIVDSIREIANENSGEKGLIHTASYSRAERLVESLPSGMAMADEKGVDSTDMIEKWQNSDYQILCSPSMMEGVDLKYDLCRWQVLLKVPYPNSHADSRVAYLLNEKSEWDWYFQETGLQIWQSIGRAVRAEDDSATYYVLDQSFEDIVKKTTPPKWVLEGLGAGKSA